MHLRLIVPSVYNLLCAGVTFSLTHLCELALLKSSQHHFKDVANNNQAF